MTLSLWFCTGSPLSSWQRSFEQRTRGSSPPFYADNVMFNGSAQRSSQLLKLLMKRESERGYFPKPDKSLFISDTPGQEAGDMR